MFHTLDTFLGPDQLLARYTTYIMFQKSVFSHKAQALLEKPI